MITSRTISREVYNVVCSVCGEEGPDGSTEQEAHDAAKAEDWTVRMIYPSGEAVRIYTCPKCQTPEDERNVTHERI
jgi:hypothetical protein